MASLKGYSPFLQKHCSERVLRLIGPSHSESLPAKHENLLSIPNMSYSSNSLKGRI